MSSTCSWRYFGIWHLFSLLFYGKLDMSSYLVSSCISWKNYFLFSPLSLFCYLSSFRRVELDEKNLIIMHIFISSLNATYHKWKKSCQKIFTLEKECKIDVVYNCDCISSSCSRSLLLNDTSLFWVFLSCFRYLQRKLSNMYYNVEKSIITIWKTIRQHFTSSIFVKSKGLSASWYNWVCLVT